MAVSFDAQAAINQIAAELEAQPASEAEIKDTAEVESKALWGGIREKANAAGKSIMDYLHETAFEGSKNPQGLGQQILAGASHPFRLANELTMESGVQGGIPFVNYDPIGGFLGLVSGAYGIPANKWAKGEPVTKMDAGVGALAVLGPVTGGAIRGSMNVARRAVPETAIDKVDEVRRGLLKSLAVGTTAVAAPVVATKTIMGKTATKVGATGARVALGASALARNMAQDSISAIETLFKAADKSLGDTGKVLDEVWDTNYSRGAHTKDGKYVDHGGPVGENRILTVGENARTMVNKIGDVKTTRSALINNMSFGLKDKAYLRFFEKINKAVDTNLPPMRTAIDPESGLPILPNRLPPSLTDPLSKGTDDAFYLASKEADELTDIRRAFEEKWDLPTSGSKDYLFNMNPGPKFADDAVAVRQFRDELNLMGFNRDASQQMISRLDEIEIALRNIEHLEKTDPNQLRAILNQIIEDTPDFTGRVPPKGLGRDFVEVQQYIREMAEDMLEALK